MVRAILNGAILFLKPEKSRDYTRHFFKTSFKISKKRSLKSKYSNLFNKLYFLLDYLTYPNISRKDFCFKSKFS